MSQDDSRSLQIEATAKLGDGLITLRGSILLTNSEETCTKIETFLKTEGLKNLYICLADVNMVDSAGLGILVRINGRAKSAKIKFSLLSPQSGVADLLQRSKLDLILNVKSGKDAREIVERLA